jgi:putative transposase
VYYYFRRLLLRTTLRERQKTGVWQQMNNTLRQQLRQIEGRNPQPSAAICASQQRNALADSQSVKTTEKRGKYMDLMVAN